MKNRTIKIVKWTGVSIVIFFVLFVIIGVLVISDRTPKSVDEYRFGKTERIMVGYIKDGKAIVHYTTFFKNDSLLLKKIAGSDPSSKDSVYISPFMEISNGAPPLIGWAFPRWELIIDKFAVRNGRKLNAVTMMTLDKSQGYFYLSIIKDNLTYKRKVRIATPDQLPSCAIPNQP
jgi:hypothetical protein